MLLVYWFMHETKKMCFTRGSLADKWRRYSLSLRVAIQDGVDELRRMDLHCLGLKAVQEGGLRCIRIFRGRNLLNNESLNRLLLLLLLNLLMHQLLLEDLVGVAWAHRVECEVLELLGEDLVLLRLEDLCLNFNRNSELLLLDMP